MHQSKRLSLRSAPPFKVGLTFWSALALSASLFLGACQSKDTGTSDTEPQSDTKSAVDPKGPIKILFLGDSLTEGYGIESDQAYPALLEKRMKKAGFPVEVINASISGSTSASALGRLKWQLKSQPDILFLALGANDGLRGVPPESIYQNLSATVTLAQENGIEVILAGMRLPLNYGPQYRKAFEAVFPRLAKARACVDVPFLLEGVGGNAKLNLADGVHPNPQGHQKMAETVWPVLEKVLKRQLD